MPQRVEGSIEIEAPVETVYDYWETLENLPQFMASLEEVIPGAPFGWSAASKLCSSCLKDVPPSDAAVVQVMLYRDHNRTGEPTTASSAGAQLAPVAMSHLLASIEPCYAPSAIRPRCRGGGRWGALR